MTAFASGVFGLFRSTCNAFEMRILIEFGPNVGMACFANRATDVRICCLLLAVPGRRQGSRQRERSHEPIWCFAVARLPFIRQNGIPDE